MPLPLDMRKRPTDVRIHVKSGHGVDIAWSDGHTSHYDFSYLRDRCPCALCNDERQKKAQMLQSAPTASPLPIFKPKPAARAATAQGNYAIQIDFTDGHSAGIFSFEYLREICPCDACARDFHSAVL